MRQFVEPARSAGILVMINGVAGDNTQRALTHMSLEGSQVLTRLLVIGYVMGIRSEGRLCEEVHLKLAYR